MTLETTGTLHIGHAPSEIHSEPIYSNYQKSLNASLQSAAYKVEIMAVTFSSQQSRSYNTGYVAGYLVGYAERLAGMLHLSKASLAITVLIIGTTFMLVGVANSVLAGVSPIGILFPVGATLLFVAMLLAPHES